MTTVKSTPTENTTDREIIISRVFDAPRELVWQAWTDPKHVVNWWGPQGFTTTIEVMDVRVGGTWKHVMHGPDGTDYPNQSVFTEVVKPERIVYSHAGGKKGGPEVHKTFTWTFEAVGDKTKLTIRQFYSTAADRDRVAREFRAIEGGNQTLGRLADYLPKIGGKPRRKLVITLPSDTEILLRRSFDAPRHLVWEAMTKPEHVARWYGPRYLTCSACEMDFRPGGSWRYVLNGPDGKGGVFKGVYHEITAPEKIVATECFDEPSLGSPQWKSIVTLTETEGVTTVTTHVVHPNKLARDGHYYSGMEAGAADTFDRLTELLDAMPENDASAEFVLTRIFDAPRELVWKAFTDPEHMKQWWGPKGCTVRAANMDLRPGGTYLYCLRTPDGHDMWGKFVYREIVPPERMVVITSFSDEKGGLTRHPMSPTWPLEMLSTFIFAEHDGKTTFTIKWIPFHARDEERKTFDEARKGIQSGWGGTLDQLTDYLAEIQKKD